MGKALDTFMQILAGIGVLIGIYLVATNYQGLNALFNSFGTLLMGETTILQGRSGKIPSVVTGQANINPTINIG